MFPKPKRKQDRALLDTYHTGRCVVCNRVGSDPCHIKSKGSGGGDFPWNVMPMCRRHHSEQHTSGMTTFAHKYANVHKWLTAHGWEFDEYKGKWVHDEC